MDSTVDALEEQVIALICKKKKLAREQVTLDSTFVELGIDSLDGIDLVFDFEDAFKIVVPDQVAREMKGVRDVMDALRAQLSEPKTAKG